MSKKTFDEYFGPNGKYRDIYGGESPTEEEVISDVYIYHDIGGYLNCCGCIRGKKRQVTHDLLGEPKTYTVTDSFHTVSRTDMIAHIGMHIRNGDIVPPHVVKALKHEIKECGDDVRQEESPNESEQK